VERVLQDQRTLVIDPTDRPAPSTKYTVALQGELPRSVLASFALSFVHRPIGWEGVVGIDSEMISPVDALPLGFNQPVLATEVAAHCKLVEMASRSRSSACR
jgi:hypothetical protein